MNADLKIIVSWIGKKWWFIVHNMCVWLKGKYIPNSHLFKWGSVQRQILGHISNRASLHYREFRRDRAWQDSLVRTWHERDAVLVYSSSTNMSDLTIHGCGLHTHTHTHTHTAAAEPGDESMDMLCIRRKAEGGGFGHCGALAWAMIKRYCGILSSPDAGNKLSLAVVFICVAWLHKSSECLLCLSRACCYSEAALKSLLWSFHSPQANHSGVFYVLNCH